MKIALLGDIAFFGKFCLINNNNLYSYFEEVAKLLSEYDLVIGNLETPFVTNQEEYGYKSAYIKSNPINIDLLKYLNVNIVNLANNHIYDYGSDSYELTKKILDENSISYFGIEDKQLEINYESNKLAIQGYCCYSTNPQGINSTNLKGVNELDYKVVKDNFLGNTNNGLFNIIGFHCGQEHINYPNYDHVILGRELAKITDYVFYGHHPHVAQGIEKINDSLLAYSLGNFCFDDVYTSKSKKPLIKQTTNNKESFILELTLEDNRLINHKVIPILIGDEKMDIGSELIKNKIVKYSEALSKKEYDYTKFRSKLIKEYIDDRKLLRNLNWYIKRLNYKSFFLILNSKINSKKYISKFKKHL